MQWILTQQYIPTVAVSCYNVQPFTSDPLIIELVNPLLNEHVLVSPHRTKRPWLGQTEAPQIAIPPAYDSACYLCPGNQRSGGQKNPPYTQAFSFVNDFPAILPGPPPNTSAPLHPMLTSQPIHGGCDVIAFHPRHDLTLAQMDPKDIEQVIDEWIRIYRERGSQAGIKYVQIFEAGYTFRYASQTTDSEK
jgi:UDPglucose--hexose-1-phosphate uridylyltransferase